MKKSTKFFCGVAIFTLAIGAGAIALSQKRSEIKEVQAAVTDVEPVSELHLDQTKIKNVTIHYETMTGPHGDTITAYVASANGTTGIPEFRFGTEGTEGSTKIAYSKSVEYIHFWYKIDNLSEKPEQDTGANYLTQVLGSDGLYPNRAWPAVNDGQWHEHTIDVGADYYNKCAGFTAKAGDLDGTIVIADIQLITTTEATSDFHLDLVKVRRVDYHYEWMKGIDGSIVNAYVAEGLGGLYSDPDVNAYMPELRFMTAGNGDSTKVPYASPVTNVHFSYKLNNTADVSDPHDSEDNGQGYCLQVVTPSAYPIYHFNPINDGQWHTWSLSVNAAEQDVFCGFIVQAGDLNGSLVIADLELNGSYEQLSNVITFASTSGEDLYNHIDSINVIFSTSADLFNGQAAWVNDNAPHFADACGVDILNSIAINGKSLQYWKDYSTNLNFQKTQGVIEYPLDLGGVFTPAAVYCGATYIEFRLVLEYFPMTSIEISFLKSFKSVSNGVTYETNNDLTFKSTLPTDISEAPKTDSALAHFSNIIFKTDLSHETSREFHITGVDLWPNGQPNYQWFAVWTDVPRSTDINQAWPHDNYRYMFDDLLIDGLPLTHYGAWGRGNYKDFDAEGNPVEDYVTEAGIAGAPNYCLVVQQSIITDQPNYSFFVRVPLKLYEDLDIDWFGTFSIREDALWLTPDGLVRNSAQADFQKMPSKTEAAITGLAVSQLANGTGVLELRTSVDMSALGYNFSDKDWEDCCLDMFKINYQTIREFNANCTTVITQEEYNIDYFNAYGATDGAANQSRLTKPVIIHVDSTAIKLLVHPKVWATLKTEIIFVNVVANARGCADNYAYFNIATAFSANTDDFFLTDLVNEGLRMNSYDKDLTGNGDGSCTTYYADAKAKYLALTSTAKARFLGENTFANARARLAKWAELNGESFDTTTGEFARVVNYNPFNSIIRDNGTALIVVVSTISAMIAVGGLLFFVRRRKETNK